MRQRKRFTREFKVEAVRLLEQGHRLASEIAGELGFRRNQLYKWQEQVAK
ncbi:MAG: transposase [candidate division NC10 bacterium]|jgi:transposase|nr:transposase [candidate division NC10 bacterium]MCZ6550239.1 transposase [candidate division NC10 bacterium]